MNWTFGMSTAGMSVHRAGASAEPMSPLFRQANQACSPLFNKPPDHMNVAPMSRRGQQGWGKPKGEGIEGETDSRAHASIL